MTGIPTQRVARQRGYSIVEMVTVLAIFGILAGSAFTHFTYQRIDIDTAVTSFVADVRYARARAITSGTHFAFNWLGGNLYQVQELQQVGTLWNYATTARRRQVPSHISVSISPAMLEFNTRGMMISATDPVYVEFSDAFGAHRTVAIWPSGQVSPDG